MGTRGDVLMEYVILTTLIILPLVVMEDVVIFDPAGSVTGNFGFVGNMFVGWIQRLICGLSLPVP